MGLSRFITLWTHADYAPEAVSNEELERAERRLQVRLPTDYRDAVLQFGLPRPTIELLDAIVDRELDLKDVSDFLGPVEMVTATEDWRDLGLPEELIAFATDSMGSLFCFPADGETREEAPVFFFDHDSGTVELIAPSFARWIDGFCGVMPH